MIKIVNKKSSDSTKNKTEKVKERESKITGLNLKDSTKKKTKKKNKQNKQTNKQKGKRENRDLQKNIGYDKDNTKTRKEKLVPKESNVSENRRKNRLQKFLDGEACSMVHLLILETDVFYI